MVALPLLAAVLLAGCSQAPSSENAPDPGGNARVPFAKAAEAKRFGFSDSTFSVPDDFNKANLEPGETVRLGRAAGANSTRLVLQWRLAEPAEGQWDDDYFDELKTVAGGFPRRPVVTLAFAPQWANPGAAGKCPSGVDCKYPPAGDRIDDWQEFVRRALREFPAADFEVWNEPNLVSYWFPGIDAGGYVDLVEATYEVVHKERSAGRTKAKLLAGSLAQVPNNGSRTKLPWEFLEEMYDEGLKGNYDAVSWHSYAYETNDEVEALGAKSSFARDWDEMRKVVRANDPGKRFWVTETGITRTGDGSTISEGEQARELGKLLRTLLSMKDVDGVYLHTLFVWSIFPGDSREAGFGLVKAPESETRSSTPAYCALVRAAGGVTELCP